MRRLHQTRAAATQPAARWAGIWWVWSPPPIVNWHWELMIESLLAMLLALSNGAIWK